MKLQGKIAIVTGGGTGIGRGTAVIFGKEGATVVVCGRRPEPLNETVNIIKQAGGNAMAFPADVSSFEQVQAMVQKVIEQFGKIDILVNSAGVYLAHDALSASEEEWNNVMQIDLKGVWVCSKSVLPQMLKQNDGRIVNIASIAGIIGFEQSAAYCAAKGAVVNLTREMGLDYAAKGVRVNAIAPGVIDTDMTKAFLADEMGKKAFFDKTPRGRIGKPEDIGYAALYLVSDEADFVIGQTLAVDGGWTIR